MRRRTDSLSDGVFVPAPSSNCVPKRSQFTVFSLAYPAAAARGSKRPLKARLIAVTHPRLSLNSKPPSCYLIRLLRGAAEMFYGVVAA